MKHLKKSQNGLENLGKLSGSRKWIKELVGIPTYVAAALLALMYVGHNILVSLAVFVCFLMIYHLVYAFAFPGFDVAGKKWRLILFVISQVLLWVIVFLGLRLSIG